MKRIGAALMALAAAISFMVLTGSSAANADPTCTGSAWYPEPVAFQNSYGNNGAHFWNSGTSPHVLYAKAYGTAYSLYCLNSSGTSTTRKLEQQGTTRCLVVNQSARKIQEGSCSSAEADLHYIGVATTLNGNPAEAIEIQSSYNEACIYQNGNGDPVTFNPCNPNTTGDVWFEGPAIPMDPPCVAPAGFGDC